MNWVKVREINFQPLVTWLTRQRSEVVLLVLQFFVGVYAVVYMIPTAMDRVNQVVESIEDRHTKQIREISLQYSRDQERDAKERQLLIDKVFGAIAPENPNLAER